VNNLNRAPVISSYSPRTKNIKIKEGENLTFSLTGDDPDDDKITIEWQVNDEPVAKNSTYIFRANYTSAGNYTINVSVSDHSLSTHLTWFLEVSEVNLAPPAVAVWTEDLSCTSVVLAWSKSNIEDFARYEIYQSGRKDELGNLIYIVLDSEESSYLIKDLSPGSTYYFVVRIVDTGGLYTDNQVMVKTRSEKSGSFIPGYECLCFVVSIIFIFAFRKKEKVYIGGV
jgi:hypothetical protein